MPTKLASLRLLGLWRGKRGTVLDRTVPDEVDRLILYTALDVRRICTWLTTYSVIAGVSNRELPG